MRASSLVRLLTRSILWLIIAHWLGEELQGTGENNFLLAQAATHTRFGKVGLLMDSSLIKLKVSGEDHLRPLPAHRHLEPCS